jgi:pimeloyl-ACP methyl ester carboxylesterase
MIASTLADKTMAEMAASILATAPPRFALIGISMGGYVSLEIMRQAPERVIKLALLSTSARPDSPAQIRQRRSLVALARARDFRTTLAQALGAILHLTHRGDPALSELTVRMGLVVGIDGLARQVEAIIGRIDSRPSLSAISVPTLVLVGEDDTLTPLERSEELAAGIPNARLVVVPQCGHASTLEQPEAVNLALIEWISS